MAPARARGLIKPAVNSGPVRVVFGMFVQVVAVVASIQVQAGIVEVIADTVEDLLDVAVDRLHAVEDLLQQIVTFGDVLFS
jgi:hypothetical protein